MRSLPVLQPAAPTMSTTANANNARLPATAFLGSRPDPPGRMPGVRRLRLPGKTQYRDRCGLAVLQFPMCPPTGSFAELLTGKTARTAENGQPARQEGPARAARGLPGNAPGPCAASAGDRGPVPAPARTGIAAIARFRAPGRGSRGLPAAASTLIALHLHVPPPTRDRCAHPIHGKHTWIFHA